MRKLIPLLLIPIGLFFSCKQSNRTEDKEKLKLLMDNFFDCIQTKNIEKIKTLTTSDFTSYVRGKILNYDSLAKVIPKFPSKTGHDLDNVSIDIDNDIAHIIYINHFTIFSDSTQTKIDFLESATFRKENDEWKIRFIHSSERK